MKTCFRFAFLTAFLIWMACRPAAAQPVLNGYAAVTCFSDNNPAGPVVALYDVRLANLQPLNTNWAAPVSHGPAGSPWNRSNLGEVFGVTFDPAGNIYVSATTVYWGESNPVGPGGSGAVYRIDGLTGSISVFTTLPNNGDALGNLEWDPAHNQLFVTNFEDGKIYRVSSTGTILSTFDPFNPDGGTPGLAPLGELVWGVGVYNNRVYFGRWNENTNSPSSVTDNQVWSVALDGAGDFLGSEQLEITVPNLPSSNYSNPTSDISFSSTGNMMLAERTMNSSTTPLFPLAHQSRILEYTFTGSWVPSGNLFSVGELGNGGSGTTASAAGGVDYGYDSYDAQTDQLIGCDQSVWASGDALDFYTPNVIYGFQRLPASGGDVTNSVLIDADGNLANQDKTQIGDIEVYKDCNPLPDPCDGIDVRADPSPIGEGCCYDLTINGIPAGAFTSVEAVILTPSTIFTGVIGPAGWNVTNSGTNATWDLAGTVPGGTVTGLHFCINTSAPAPQMIEVILHGKNGEDCRFTVDIDCEPVDPTPCFTLQDLQVKCKEKGPNGWIYNFSFTVTNYSPFSLPPYNLPAENIVVYAPGLTITPLLTPLVPVLNYGQTSGTLNYTLTSPTIMPGDHICVLVQLHGRKLQYDYQWCCPPDSLCFDLPPCKDCCDSIDFTIDHNSGKQIGNTGATISSGNVTVTPGPIMKVQANIMSVERSRVWCPDPSTGVYAPVANASSILGVITGGSINPVMPVAVGFIPPTSEVIWGTVTSGVPFAGGSISLNLAFPGTNLGWRCLDTLRVCVRYTFTDTACRTCDTVVYYKVTRCGNIDIVKDSDNPLPTSFAEAVQGAGTTIGEPLYSEPVAGPGLALVMGSHTQGALAVSHWWQDNVVGVEKVRLINIKVTPEPGIDIVSFVPQGGGEGGVISDRTATAPLDLNVRETDYFGVTFSNPTNADFFALRVVFDYVNTDEPEVRLTSREYLVYGDLTGGGGSTQGRIAVAENGNSKATLYKLLIGANSTSANWLSPACFRFTPPQGVRILASGPMPDSATAEFHVLKSMSKATSMLLQLPSPGDYRKEYIEEEKTVELWLVLEGEGSIFDLNWEALNLTGETIGSGTVEVSSTSTVRDGDHYVAGAAIRLLDAYPNPTDGNVTTRFNLTRSENVTVTVVDLTGREVTRLVNDERLGAGSHEYALNLKSLPSGSYFIRLTTEEGTQTRSVVRK